MDVAKLSVKRREESGKTSIRRLRAQGEIPAVAYGKALAATALKLSPRELNKALEGEHHLNTVFELSVDGGETILALLADHQIHPLTRQLLHVDFLKIDADKPVDVEVPLELTGKCSGVVMGGELLQVYRKLPIRCLPGDIPVKISHDVTSLELEQSVSAQALTLPQRVEVRLPAARTVAAVVTPKHRGAEAEEETATAAAAAAAAAGAAPVAGAAEEGKKAEGGKSEGKKPDAKKSDAKKSEGKKK